MIADAEIITAVKTAAERLKYARVAEGLSQEALAELAGVTQGTIGNMEAGIRGKRSPSWPAVATALKRRYEWLRFGKGPEYQSSEPLMAAEPTLAAIAPAKSSAFVTGATIASLSHDLRLTTAALASLLKIPEPEAAGLVAGEVMPSPEQKRLLGAIFNIDPNLIADATAVIARPIPGNARKRNVTLDGYEYQLIQQYRHLPEEAQHVLRSHAAKLEETFGRRSSETPYSRVDAPRSADMPDPDPPPETDYGSW